MSTNLIIFIVIQLSALIYFVELLRRIYIRTKEYELKETRLTLPFGFLRLRHILVLYILTYAAWIVGSLFLYHFFINPPLAVSGATLRVFNLDY
jgi:hypothetical protein